MVEKKNDIAQNPKEASTKAFDMSRTIQRLKNSSNTTVHESHQKEENVKNSGKFDFV